MSNIIGAIGGDPPGTPFKLLLAIDSKGTRKIDSY